MYRVKGYLIGLHQRTERFEEATLESVRERALSLKAQGFHVEIRDPDGRIVSDDQNGSPNNSDGGECPNH